MILFNGVSDNGHCVGLVVLGYLQFVVFCITCVTSVLESVVYDALVLYFTVLHIDHHLACI